MTPENLRVAVIFEGGKLRPIWVDYRGQKITVKEVAYAWESKLGNDLLRHYSVTDGQSSYELIFNSNALQ